MGVKNLASITKMKSYEDIFGSGKEQNQPATTVELNIEELNDFPNHPFKVVEDDDMRELIADVAENGILFPVEVYQHNGQYYLTSGHRRKYAAKKCGLSKIPAEIKSISKNEAVIRMVSANRYRSHISPIEKGKAYKMELEAIKDEKKRNPDKKGIRSDSELATLVGDSRANIQRFIRLTNLTEEWQEAVEEELLGVTPAQPLAQMDYGIQKQIFDVWDTHGRPKLTAIITSDLHVEWKNNNCKLSDNDICVLLGIYKEEPKAKPRKVAFSEKKLSKYFPLEMPQDEIEAVIEDLLERWAYEHGYDSDAEKENSTTKGQMRINDTECNMVEEE